jgi:glycosyltransferase involved in cell wall biosynthesis
LDYGLPKIEMSSVRVVYVSRKGNVLVRIWRFLRQALEQADDKQAIFFIKYFTGVSLALRLFGLRHCFVLDIRTGSVHKSPIVRKFHDAQLKFETRFFRHVSVISQSLAEKLGLGRKAHILPLGADVISYTDKTFNTLDLLYVGTLFNRNVDVTIRGFKKFYDEFKNQISLSYTIVGVGLNNEETVLRELVSQYELSHVVKVIGRVPHPELAPYFDACNIGVSYVPLTDYYDCQPVTKTFEYLLSGLPVIATGTSENKMVITPENGVIVCDSAEDIYDGLKVIHEKRDLFDSARIRNQAYGYTWEKIVEENLKIYLGCILN